MKSANTKPGRSLVGAAIAIALAASATPASAQTTYTAHQVIAPSGTFYTPSAINNAGQIAGYFSDTTGAPNRCFVTGVGGSGSTVLGLLGGTICVAQGVNDRGQVVGWATTQGDAAYRAFITDASGRGMRDLGTFGGTSSAAFGVDNEGRAVGGSYEPGEINRAFITGKNGVGMINLGAVGGNYSGAYGVNSLDQVVGYSAAADGISFPAFLTGPKGAGMFSIGTLGGPNSLGSAVNSKGQVVGQSDTAGGLATHAFLTHANGAGMIDLGTLGGVTSEAYGINAHGQVVGHSSTAAGIDGAFLYTGGKMIDLTSILILPSGVYLIEAVAINDLGQIAGYGSDGNAYLISPPAGDQLAALRDVLVGAVGAGNWLVDFISLAQTFVRTGDTVQACRSLNAFSQGVATQKNENFSVNLAVEFTAAAQGLKKTIGCPS